MLIKSECKHNPKHAERLVAKWDENGALVPIRHCAKCGKVWRLAISKSLGEYVTFARLHVESPIIPDIAKSRALGAGERWITVHPNGEDEPGVPVIIKEHADGTAHVIGGAGGKINYLKLTKLRSEDEWKQAAGERKEAARAAEKQRVESMSDEEKATEQHSLEDLKTKRDMTQAEYVHAVMAAHGVSDKDWQIPEETLAAMGEKPGAMAQRRHMGKMVGLANNLVAQGREDLLNAADEVIAHTIGDIPGSEILPEPTPEGAGLGYVACVQRKAKENGLTVDETQTEKADISWRRFLDASGGDEEAAMAKSAQVARLHEALAGINAKVREFTQAGLLDTTIQPETPRPEAIAAMLVAKKKLDLVNKQIDSAGQAVKEAGVAQKAAWATVRDISDDEAKDALAQELGEEQMTRAASEILGLVDEEVGGRPPLREYVSGGHYNALNEAFLAITHAPCPIDRVTADILGPVATAQLLVEHLRSGGEDLEKVHDAMVRNHVKTQREIADKATEEYTDTMAQREEIEVPNITNADSLIDAQMANDTRADLLNDARSTLGTALGKLEGRAAMITGLESTKPHKELRVALGAINNEQAIGQARVLGLTKGYSEGSEDADTEYRIDSDGTNRYLTVTKSGMDKLVNGYDKAHAELTDKAMAIKRGDQDEVGWLPRGFAVRPTTSFEDPAQRSLAITEPLTIGESTVDINATVEDYIGARLADGQDPASLRADMMNADFVEATVPEDKRAAYYKAMRDCGPYSTSQVENPTGQQLNEWADRVVATRRAALGDDANMAAINSQSLPTSDATYDAIHRALSEVPHAKIMNKGLGELTPQDKDVLRDYFWEHATKEQRPDEGAGGPTAWDRYVHVQGSPQNAYRSLMAAVKGEFSKRLADHAGRITGKEIKTAATRIDGWDRHVLGLLPAEEQLELPSLASRVTREKAANDAIKRHPELAMAAQRTTIGERAEAQVGSMFDYVAKNFDPKTPVAIPRNVDMSTGDNARRQRAIKLFKTTKRMGLNLGVGAGKTSIGFGCFTELNADGKVKRAIYAVPSAVVGQFGCVRGDTILADPIRGIEQSFADWMRSGVQPFVSTVDENGNVGIELASRPFIKGRDMMYRVSLDDGRGIVVTQKHRFLTPDGWQYLSDLAVGNCVAVDDEVSRADSASSERDSRDGYLSCSRYRDAQSRPSQSPPIAQQSVDARDNTQHYPTVGDRAHKQQYIRGDQCDHLSSGSHLRPCVDTCCHFGQYPDLADGDGLHSVIRHFRSAAQSSDKTCYCQPIAGVDRCPTCNQVLDCPVCLTAPFCAAQLLLSCRNASPFGRASNVATPTAATLPRQLDKVDGRDGSYRRCQVLEVEHEQTHATDRIASPSSYTYDPPASTGEANCRLLAAMQPASRIPSGEVRPRVCGVAHPVPAQFESGIGQIQKVIATDQCLPGPSSVACEPPSDDIFHYSRILSVSQLGMADVYDISVPRTHNYLAQGIWNHNSEALRFLEPGKYQWFSEPSASATDRRAAYGDASKNMVVVTHQSLRDDLAWAVAKQQFGGDIHQSYDFFDKAPEADRKTAVKSAMDAEGWNFDMSFIDEGHNLLGRAGKADSRMANTIDALTFNTPYYLSATADPIKNDASEAFSMLHKIDPDRYNDEPAFMQKYGLNTVAAAQALKQEIQPYTITGTIKPESTATRTTKEIELTPEQSKAYKEVLDMYQRARQARRSKSLLSPEDYKATQEKLTTALTSALDPAEREALLTNVHKLHAKVATRGKGGRFSYEGKAGARKERAQNLASAMMEMRNVDPSQYAKLAEMNPQIGKLTQRLQAHTDALSAVRGLSPHIFASLSEDAATTKAYKMLDSLAMTRDGALDRVVSLGHYDPKVQQPCAKANAIVDEVAKRTAGGKPGILFCHSREAIPRLVKAMQAKGVKVLTLTGGDTAADKERTKLKFQDPSEGVGCLILSDAGATGLNLQRASWADQYDTPHTAMMHEQRIGRMERTGQINKNISATDWTTNTPYEANRRRRLKTKNALREVFTSPTEQLDDTGLAYELWNDKAAQVQRDMMKGAQ
mgnify:FL=1